MSAKTVDQKLSFEATDMTPGPRGRVWRRDCLQLAGKCDSRGFSIADTLLRQDEYAVIGPAVGGGGMAAPGAPPPPVGATQQREAQQYRKKRLKEAYEWVVLHCACEMTRDLVLDAPYFQDGPGTNVSRNRAEGTLTFTMRSYLLKLKDRHGGKVVLRETPCPPSKAKRMEIAIW
jgi:hypothetical protein